MSPMIRSAVARLRVERHRSIFGLVLFAALLIVPGAQAQDPAQPISSGTVEAADAEAVLAYWTAERMAAAKPMPLPALDAAARTAPDGYRSPVEALGPAVLAHSGAPGDEPIEELIDPLDLGAPPTEAGVYPFSYTSYQLYPINLYKRHLPYMQTGKLFFSVPGQGNFVCSGASINSSNLAVVWTAGHCVHTPGVGFHTNVLFAPARANGNNHKGVFTAFQLFTLNGWSNLGQFEWDLGAIVANRGGLAPIDLIGNKVGFLGYASNVARQQHFHALGYPAAPPFGGEKQQVCAAAWATDDQPSGGASAGPDTVGIGCDSTGGTSGGPWIVDLSKLGGATNVIHGVNSYRYGGGPPNSERLYSPYHGTGADNLRNAAQAVVVP